MQKSFKFRGIKIAKKRVCFAHFCKIAKSENVVRKEGKKRGLLIEKTKGP
jgi:hypothetical protein